MNLSRNFLSTAFGVFALAGCGGSERGSSSTAAPADPSLPPVLGGDGSAVAGAPSAAGPDLVAGSSDEARPIQLEDACIIDRAGAALVKEPVDIVLVLDNSGSMADELAAVEQNINVNFAAILAESGIDYRVILVSRHRREVRDDSGESSTSICVSSPLSAATDCDDTGRPAFSERFFHYSVKVESTDSFDVLLDTFAPPFQNSGREDKFDQAPDGWSAWLRPSAKKVFLEMTDDAAEMASASFVEQLTALSPAAFGTPDAPRFVFHSIVGVVEKDPPTAAYLPEEPLVSERCEGNANDVENAGAPYQELSRLTGGLRFPLCQFDGFDVVFRSIAEDVVVTSGVACDFAIPTPPAGQTLNLDQLAVSLARADGSGALQLGQTQSLAECQAGAFYIAGDRINLCPAACEAVRSDPSSDVEVLFTCKSTFLPR
jgi:hypothetical protein